MNLFFIALQAAVADRLSRKHELKGIPFLLRQSSDFDNRLEEIVSSGDGICVVVLQPLPEKVAVVAPGLSFSEVVQKVLIVEDILLNTSGQTALGLAEIISRQLHQWTPPVGEVDSALVLQATKPWDVDQGLGQFGRNEFELSFTVTGTLPVVADLG